MVRRCLQVLFGCKNDSGHLHSAVSSRPLNKNVYVKTSNISLPSTLAYTHHMHTHIHAHTHIHSYTGMHTQTLSPSLTHTHTHTQVHKMNNNGGGWGEASFNAVFKGETRHAHTQACTHACTRTHTHTHISGQ